MLRDDLVSDKREGALEFRAVYTIKQLAEISVRLTYPTIAPHSVSLSGEERHFDHDGTCRMDCVIS